MTSFLIFLSTSTQLFFALAKKKKEKMTSFGNYLETIGITSKTQSDIFKILTSGQTLDDGTPTPSPLEMVALYVNSHLTPEQRGDLLSYGLQALSN
jgi:hypothetical protein